MNMLSWSKLIVLAGLCGWFGNYVYKNPKGIYQQRLMAAENAKEQAAITHLTTEITDLKTRIFALNGDRFAQEQVIRQDLQMSCTNEYVYLLPQKSV
jgi:cell division protein FtsB